MPLSDREAFKVGYLARCVEDGMDRNAILASVKSACDKLTKAAFPGLDQALDLGKDIIHGAGHTALGVGLPLALAAPPVLGGLAGAGLAKATDINDDDVKDIKDREVLNTYKTETARLLRQKALRDMTRARPRRHSYFG